MIIPFWSNARRSGTTCNLAAISIMCAMEAKRRITLLENHFNERSLAEILFSCEKRSFVREDVIYYLGHGITDCLIPQLADTERLEDGAVRIEVLKDWLYYIPKLMVPGEVFELSFYRNFLPVLEKERRSEQLWFIDTKCNSNINTKTVIEYSQITAVNILLDIENIRYYIKHYSTLNEKAVFLLSSKGMRDYRAIKLLLDQNIPRERIIIIPYCEEFLHAASRGRSIEFITCFANCKENNPNYEFINAIHRAANVILTAVLR